jgi:hypothetical protein
MAEQPPQTPQTPPPPVAQSAPTGQGQPETRPPPNPPESSADAPADLKDAKASQDKAAVSEALEQLRRSLPAPGDTDRSLVQTVDRLIREGADPLRANQRSFQHEVAYALQDVERTKAGFLPLSEQARLEMNRLAAGAPGLENPRLQDLLGSTGAISDDALIRDIRIRAAEVGQQTDQNTATIRSQIEALENRTRLAPKAERGQESTSAKNAPPSRDAGQSDDRADQPSVQDEAGRRGDPIRTSQSQRHFLDGAAAASLNGVFRTMRGPGATITPPWEAAPTPLAGRLSTFENRMQQGRDDITLRGVEKSGRAAFEALEGFRIGEGAIILNRIREAARSDPGGMAGVLSEMREGGKFADLRLQFNNTLADDKGVAAAYDKAASALARYGQDRVGYEQIIARRPDAANLTAKLEAMDKEIGQAGGEVPSRRDGKNMLDDLSTKVAEMLRRAADSIKHVFNRGASHTSTASPSPS